MNNRWMIAVAVLIVLFLGAIVIGGFAYNMGLAQGVAGVASYGRVPVPATGDVPAPYYPYPYAYRPFGFGFGFLGCLFPLLFFFLIFAVIRGFIWRGRWGWHGHRRWDGTNENGVPSMIEEWHRKMHESMKV